MTNGEVWPLETIVEIKEYIDSYELWWSVVARLPVSEDIKYAGKERDALIENYKISLANLGKAGVTTVCYNFMPVLDCARTDINHRLSDGTYTLYFDKVKFAYFDCFILERFDAHKDYEPEIIKQAEELAATITEAEKLELIDTIIVKTQGFVNGNITEEDKQPAVLFKKLLQLHAGIDRDMLCENLAYFLSSIMPTC